MKKSNPFTEFMEIMVNKGCNEEIARRYFLSSSKIGELIAWARNKNITKYEIINSIGLLYSLTFDHAKVVVENRWN